MLQIERFLKDLKVFVVDQRFYNIFGIFYFSRRLPLPTAAIADVAAGNAAVHRHLNCCCDRKMYGSVFKFVGNILYIIYCVNIVGNILYIYDF